MSFLELWQWCKLSNCSTDNLEILNVVQLRLSYDIIMERVGRTSSRQNTMEEVRRHSHFLSSNPLM